MHDVILTDFDYLQLTLGTGTAPDEPFDISGKILSGSALTASDLHIILVLKGKVFSAAGSRLFTGKNMMNQEQRK